MRQKTWALALTVGLLGAGGATQAALVPYTANGVDLVYDDDYTPVGASSPGLTWTRDANLAATMTFGVTGINANGTMSWDKALEWIAAMNAANYAGANDWRLWSALNSDGTGPCGPAFNCDDSELGHLFYTEGGLSQNQAITSSTALTNVFTNMQDSLYWSGTEFSASDAWRFRTQDGVQYNGVKDVQLYGWAVRPGQIAAAPLPGTALLMALGFGAMAVLRRARRRLW
jgi:hypothetical protein